MGYAQWVVIKIINSFRNGTITVENAKLFWGKFYKDGDKNAEMSSDEVNSITIPANDTVKIYSCGRSDSASGTEGQFDLFEETHKICTVYWSCPWGSKGNDFQTPNREPAGPYMVSVGDWNRDSGALGQIDVEIVKKG